MSTTSVRERTLCVITQRRNKNQEARPCATTRGSLSRVSRAGHERSSHASRSGPRLHVRSKARVWLVGIGLIVAIDQPSLSTTVHVYNDLDAGLDTNDTNEDHLDEQASLA
jgi:hypothetical protein